MTVHPFRIEEYFARYEFKAELMFSASDCETRSLTELLEMEPCSLNRLLQLRLGYTESPGAPELRQAASMLYDGVEPDDILVMAAAEEGIFASYQALLEPGDHVIVESPCYESAFQAPRFAGCTVSAWERRFADGWAHDFDALERLIRSETKLLYINTPHNPTGMHMSRETLDRVIDFARAHDLILFCDEVYRELEHATGDLLPTVAQVYERGVALGSISKTYGLPGLRLGWLVSQDRSLLEKVLSFKHYTTICASAPSEFLTALALRHRTVLAARNLQIVKDNLALLDEFVMRRSTLLQWERPVAGPIGMIRMDHVDVDGWCRKLLEATDVLALPGSVFDQPEFLRVGFGRANFSEALDRVDRYLG